MTKQPNSTGHLRLVLLAVALLLPTLSLVPLGTFWLWERGYLPYWAIGTCIAVAGAYYLQRRLIVPAPRAADLQAADDPGDRAWTPRQEEAWGDVTNLASGVSADRMTSRDGVLNLGLETIELVARRLHPERRDPLLQFTVPEALAVIERTSDGLRDFIVKTFPLGDRITVAQLMWLYRWRGAVGLAERGYDLWRIVRLLNPLAAATQELRERFTRQVYQVGREHLARRLAQAYVKEVGRAAIDLYGGNLRVTHEQLGAHVSAASKRDMAAVDARAAEPMRILVAGQTGSGKSSLLNALAGAVAAAVDVLPATRSFTPHTLTRDGLPSALIIDSPGLTGTKEIAPLIDRVEDCDMVLWVCAATRAARDIDRAALEAIRQRFVAQPNRRRPPMLLVLTHIDALRPFAEWAPPYDLADTTRAKSKSIRAAIEAAGAELGFADSEIVPVRADMAAAAYNIDALWAKMIELVPEAQRARLLRSFADINSARGWATIWSQAANAGRVIRGTLLSRDGSSKQRGS